MEPDFVTAAVALRTSHPQAPARELLDLVLKGEPLGEVDPRASWLLPSSAFGHLIAEAFDGGLREWVRMTSPPTPPRMIANMLDLWRQFVLARFLEGYGGHTRDSGHRQLSTMARQVDDPSDLQP